jgi:hypothetical protein
VRYETLTAAPEREFPRLARGLRLNFSADEYKQALALAGAKASRFNQGRPGRGENVLTRGQHRHLRRLARFYPGFDFSPLGLA